MIYFDPPSNTLVLDAPADRARILSALPAAKPLMNGYVACPASLYNLQVLRWLGLPIIPPMREDNYDWPIRPGRIPLPHQKIMSNFLVAHPKCFNLSDMGTMKTMSALWAADFVMKSEPGAKALVVCPLSTMQRTWGDAIFKDLMGRRTYTVLYGDANKREELLKNDTDFYIINFDGLGIGWDYNKGRVTLERFAAALDARKDIRLVILDEADAYRDASTRRHRIAMTLLAQRPYLWLATGTPTPTGPLDAYGLAKLVNNAGGESFMSYKMRTMYKVSNFKWVPKRGAHEAASALLQPAIRFDIKDCVNLPPCTTELRDVPLSREQTKLIAQLKEECLLEMGNGKQITAVNEAVLRMKLIQISCGAVYDTGGGSHPVDAKPRIAELRAVMAQSRAKTIVFAPLTSVLRLLHSDLSRDHSVALIYGGTPQKERNEIFRRFQMEAEPRVLIADPGTMSHGLDLFAAALIVWYGPTDRTVTYLQANKRIDRPGQTFPTTIVQLASTPTEREIYRRLENNETLQGVILNLIRGTGND